ncbi:MAG: 2-oxoacid:ferredoxin oxidoreductase subunit beta [Planctomycetota bacterium]|jgi:2-oxoglutarate ferredoxin oxidoreductase subunit beta
MNTRVNRLGLPRDPYKGAKSTLCAGCGHDAITNSLIRVLWEADVPPHLLAKMSGIGCSSKTTAYFGGTSWGFNAVHGRMPSVATGAHLANRTLRPVGVSGDGDSASIGIGQFVHAMRRNVPLVYLVENNGVYGLTKGQFSATADKGSRLKTGVVNEMEPIDLCGLALELGCGFVARSFSADKKQLDTILKAALSWRGTALIDIISPCVTFNNHSGSTKSYDYSKEKQDYVHEVGFVPHWSQDEVEVGPGEVREVTLPDGGRVVLHAVEEGFDTSDAMAARLRIDEARRKGEFLTGLFHLRTSGEPAFDELLELADEPLATMPEERVRPSREALTSIIEGLR